MATDYTEQARQRLDAMSELPSDELVDLVAGILEEHEILYDAQTSVYRRQVDHTAEAAIKLFMLAAGIHTVKADPMQLAMAAQGYDLRRTPNPDGTITFDLVPNT